MPFIPAPNIVEVQWRTTFAGQETMNRIHVDVLGAPSADDVQNLATECGNWWTGNVQDLVPPDLELREVYAKSIATQPGPEATFTAGLPAAGLLGQPALPSNCSICASLRSGETGRSARGRWYWQGLTENQVAGNVVASGTQTDILAALFNLKGVISGAGFLWVIVSFYSNNVVRPGGPVYFPVNTITMVDGFIDSQRRRLPGRGR